MVTPDILYINYVMAFLTYSSFSIPNSSSSSLSYAHFMCGRSTLTGRDTSQRSMIVHFLSRESLLFEVPERHKGMMTPGSWDRWTVNGYIGVIVVTKCDVYDRGAYLCSRYLCSPVPMFPEPMFPGAYVPRYLCSPVPMFPGFCGHYHKSFANSPHPLVR